MICPYCRNEIRQETSACPHCGNSLSLTATATMPLIVSQASEVDRAEFIRRTYTHMAMAILAFIVLETLLLNWGGSLDLVRLMVGERYSWLIVLAAFMGISYVADKWARNSVSRDKQYAGLGLYVVAETIIFLPLLFVAKYYSDESLIGTAGLLTLGLFGGLTFVVFITKKDFSFLRTILGVGGFVALGFIVASTIFGFTLGLLFSAIMVVFASIAILYTTSNILNQYRTDQYVAASLGLFASIMLLFWYILSILLSGRK